MSDFLYRIYKHLYCRRQKFADDALKMVQEWRHEGKSFVTGTQESSARASLYLWAVAGGAIPGMKDYAPKKKGP